MSRGLPVVNEPRGWKIALHAWSLIGAVALASIVILPPAMVPDADAPPSIDDSKDERCAFKSCAHALSAFPATPPPPMRPLQAGRRAAGYLPSDAWFLEIETALPTRAPPR